MPELITRTARLVPYAKRPKQVPSYVTAYVHEPLADEPGAYLGNFYLVIEVLVSGRSSEDVADLIITTLGEHYYNKASEEASPLNRFEAAIKATNHELADYVSQGNAAWIGKLSAIVAVQVANELHVAQTGSAEAFLYRGKAAAQIAIDGNKGKPAVPSKTFGSIASGQLESGDRLLMATPALIHQLSLEKLHSIVGEASPNSAIAEITELLQNGASERVAALVIELTTPELAALQVRSDEPSEIQLGGPENVFETAKLAAAPLAQATVSQGKRVHTAARAGWGNTKPHARRLSLAAAEQLRSFLTGRGARKRIGIVAGIIGILIITLIWSWLNNGGVNGQLTMYEQDYRAYLSATSSASQGQKVSAAQQLESLNKKITLDFHTTALDNHLKNLTKFPDGKPVVPGMPRSIASFKTLVAAEIIQLEQLRSVRGASILNFKSIADSNIAHFEYSNNTAYAIDSHHNSAIYVVNLSTKTIKTSHTNTGKLGEVVATTLAASGNGMFILTSKPSVWFYNFDTDTLTEQTVNQGSWPTAKNIASFASNLYLLNDGVIAKFVKTYTGYSPGVTYLSSAEANGLQGATALAVDGKVYALSPGGLAQYLSGTLKNSAEVPYGLTAAASLRSSNNGGVLIATDTTTNHIGIWTNTQTLNFAGQYSLTGVKSLSDATYDATSQSVYALADNQILQFTP